jgi:hypothetical protein
MLDSQRLVHRTFMLDSVQCNCSYLLLTTRDGNMGSSDAAPAAVLTASLAGPGMPLQAIQAVAVHCGILDILMKQEELAAAGVRPGQTLAGGARVMGPGAHHRKEEGLPGTW